PGRFLVRRCGGGDERPEEQQEEERLDHADHDGGRVAGDRAQFAAHHDEDVLECVAARCRGDRGHREDSLSSRFGSLLSGSPAVVRPWSGRLRPVSSKNTSSSVGSFVSAPVTVMAWLCAVAIAAGRATRPSLTCAVTVLPCAAA